MMDILVACERSGIVREAFRAYGHNAISCDLVPCEDGRVDYHHQGDVRGLLSRHWDMIIAFPDCTYLCSSGLHWNKRRPERQLLTDEAVSFVKLLMNADCDYFALENPIGCISTRIRKPDQIIQPWQFGHPESKSTCLWLRNLPKLKPTNILTLPACGYWNNQTASRQNRLAPSATRAMDRARTYTGIAQAMAAQWS